MKIILALAIVAISVLPADAQYRYRGYGHGSYYDRGGGLVGGIIGGVIGGAIAETFARPRYQQPVGDAIEYCMQRFRSYNPETGVYIGFDGSYHRCP